MRINVHCWGGLAGQLTGLVTAMWIEREYGRAPRILFHDGGVSRRPLEIRDLVSGYEFRIVHESAAIDSLDNRSQCTTRRLKIKGRLGVVAVGMGRKITLISPIESITKESLESNFHNYTLSLRGYCSDLRIHREVLECLSQRIERTSRANFLEDAC